MLKLWIKRVLGCISLLLGVMIFCWVGYNLVWPTKEFESSFHGLFQLATPVALVVVGWKWFRDGGPSVENLAPPDSRSAEAEEARRLFHETLPSFISEVENKQPVALIKFPMLMDKGQTKEVWGVVLSVSDGLFKVGSPVDRCHPQNVPAAVVVDWQIVRPDGRLRGSWQLRAALKYHERHGTWFSPRIRKEQAMLAEMP